MTDRTTEEQFLAEHNTALKEDLKQARHEIALLSDQVRDGKAEQEQLSYKADHLLSENARVTASREQYERVAIRTTAILDGALTSLMAVLQSLQAEIRDAAFTKVPGSAKINPPAEPANSGSVEVEKIAETFAAGFDADQTPLPPKPRFGNGAQQH